jgi:YHS domain-containing protein
MNHHANLTIDPVCLKQLVPSEAEHQIAYRNVSYRFCSAHCLERFVEIPEFFIVPHRLEDIRAVPKQHRLRFNPVSSSVLEEAIERLRTLQGVIVDSGSSRSPRPIRHEQSARFPVSNSPDSREQTPQPDTTRTRQVNDAHEHCCP